MPTVPEGAELFVNRRSSTPRARPPTPAASPPPASRYQNSLRMNWSRDEVDAHLHSIMKGIHQRCVEAAAGVRMAGNYVAGANIAGFVKVADAMLDHGIV